MQELILERPNEKTIRRFGELFIKCRDKEHALVGQADDGEHLVGLYPAKDGQCAGGVEIGCRPCERCGATEDDKCPYETPQ